MHGADRVTDRNGTDPIAGHHLHKLVRSAPLIDFTFRAGPRDSDPYFVRTDGVSRGRGDGLGYNVSVNATSDGTHEVHFNASNAFIILSGNPFLMSSSGIRLRLDLTLHSLPSGSLESVLIAGHLGAFWIEVYPGGELCFWVQPSSGMPQTACRSITLGAATDVVATYTRSTGEISISVNGSTGTVALPANSSVAGDGSVLLIGSLGANGANYYGSPSMTLRRLRVYDQPSYTEESPKPY